MASTAQNIALSVLTDLMGDHSLTKAERHVLQASLNEFLPNDKKIAVDGDFGSKTAQGIVDYFKTTGNYPLYSFLDQDIVDLLTRHGKDRLYSPPPFEADGITALSTRDILTADWPLMKGHIEQLQSTLDIKIDGDFGNGTARRVVQELRNHPEYLQDISPSIVRRVMAINPDSHGDPARDLRGLLAQHAPRALYDHIRDTGLVVKGVPSGTFHPAVFEMQALLKATGFYNGDLSGEMDNSLRKAMVSFGTGKTLSGMNETFIDKTNPEGVETPLVAEATPAKGPATGPVTILNNDPNVA